MSLPFRRDSLILFLGDVLILQTSVFLALLMRRLDVPNADLLVGHLIPFSILSILFISVFFIAGLYEKHTQILRKRLPTVLFNALSVNAFIAIAFFYLIPNFGIEPRTILFLYIVISSTLLFLWRLRGINFLRTREKSLALIIGEGDSVNEIIEELNSNEHHSIIVASTTKNNINEKDFDSIIEHIKKNNIKVIVANFDDPKLEKLWARILSDMFLKLRFIDLYKLYEELFDRIPLDLLRYSWFFENVSLSRRAIYDSLKRLMDIVIASILYVVSLVFYPIVALLIKIEDGGDVFITQERVGAGNKHFNLLKFRTMSFDDSRGASSENKITKIGRVLRATRIDELPQLWNVISGSLSLIGPRPELPVLVKEYEKEIPHYAVRHFIKPGLSGWAQIKDYDAPRRGVDIEKTKKKLSYDLFYLKNRSLVLDLKIALKTINTLLSKTGT